MAIENTSDQIFIRKMEQYTHRQMETYGKDYRIPPELYTQFDVKRGLRDINGNGVVAGITEISDVKAKEMIDGKLVPCHGRLLYRGYNVIDLSANLVRSKRGSGFEETAYLLLFGELPSNTELDEFRKVLAMNRRLPTNFVRDFIMKAPSKDIMNSMIRSVLTLASYDPKADDISMENVLQQSLMLISLFPMFAVYAYHAYNHYERDESMYIHRPDNRLSFAGNILRMLRPDKKFTDLEERVLDAALILHMEHGGGNNSTFTTRVVTSAGSDTYAVMAAALASLKGPKHGGANIKVVHMMDDIMDHVLDPEDEEMVTAYLQKILDGRAFDRAGLIYGVGHAVYSLSDPRALILQKYAERLAQVKKCNTEYKFYKAVAEIAPRLISGERTMFKGVSMNVDFYSGFCYRLLNIPVELFTPIFAIARIVGWTAHRMEELSENGKIMRPAYKSLATTEREYIPVNER